MFTYSYDLAGRLSQIEYPAETGIVARFDDGATPTPNPGWNPNGQLTHLRYLKNGAHLHSFEYDYDDAGNRKTFIDTPQNTANAIEWRYSYDWLDRLVEVQRGDGGVTPTTARVYAYDESDNRTYVDFYDLNLSHRYVNDAADQVEKRQVGTFLSRNPGDYSDAETFTYDQDGNLIGRVLDPNGTPQTTALTWSDFDRLIRVEAPSQIVSNNYDIGGARKKKVDASGATRFFQSGVPTTNEWKTDSPSGRNYIMGHQLLGFEENNQFHYFVADGLTSIRLLVDSAGAEAARYIHGEFGQRVDFLEATASSSKSYVGGMSVHDDSQSTGLLYMLRRHYDPELGRFVSRDPMGIYGGYNLYSYAHSNPVNNIDPTGLNPVVTGPGGPAPQVHVTFSLSQTSPNGLINVTVGAQSVNGAVAGGFVTVQLKGKITTPRLDKEKGVYFGCEGVTALPASIVVGPGNPGTTEVTFLPRLTDLRTGNVLPVSSFETITVTVTPLLLAPTGQPYTNVQVTPQLYIVGPDGRILQQPANLEERRGVPDPRGRFIPPCNFSGS